MSAIENGCSNQVVPCLKSTGESLEDARKLFDEMPERTLPLYTALIGSCSKSDQWIDKGLMPDNYVVPILLKACAGMILFKSGQMVHAFVVRKGIIKDAFVSAYSYVCKLWRIGVIGGFI